MKYINYVEGVYKSKWLSKFINLWCFTGEKSSIEKIVYFSLYFLQKKLKYCPLFIFLEVVEKLKPTVGLKIYRFGKGNTKRVIVVPNILKISSQYKQSICWLVKAIKLRKEKTLALKIYYELCETLFTNISSSLKKKKEYYKYVVMFKSIKKFKW